MRKINIFTKKLLSVVLAVSMMVPTVYSSHVSAADINNISNPDYKIQKTVDGTDAFVYAYNVMDYGADNSGNRDNTEIFQKLLNKAGELGGAIVYAPAGRYKITGSLSIPKGVTLRGDWTKPIAGQPLTSGTILMAYTGRNQGEDDTPFIEMVMEDGLMDVTIWYPEQNPNNITPYSPTIRLGNNTHFGNEYHNVKNVTLVNSYIGIRWNMKNGGASPVINGVYGTPLMKGIEIDRLVDVGRIDNVSFSPDYWSGSGLENAPAKGSSFENWIYNNGIGIVMRRNDWSYACYIDIDGYNIGYDTKYSTEGSNTPNGHHYKFNLRNCKTGILFETSSYVGILFDDINMYNCETGVKINGGTTDVVQFAKSKFACSKYAINVDKTSSTKVLLYQSTVTNGVVNIDGGTLMSTGCTYSNKAPQIVIGNIGRAAFSGNTFPNGKNILNNSMYKSELDNANIAITPVPDFPDEKGHYQSHMPKNLKLYVVTNAPYYANNSKNHGGGNDCTNAIQNALNDASNNDGGIVFLPSGHYRINGHLTIPSNVELRGATDLSTVPHGSGAILEAYESKGNPNGAPLISISANAGVRGIIVNYPEQKYDEYYQNGVYSPVDYPATMRGLGNNIYVINTGIRAATYGLDLDTNRCDNHYVEWLTGHVNKICVKVGNGSSNGIISNLMFNTIVFGCGQESPKFGGFPNSPNTPGGVSNSPVYDQQLRELEFLIVGDSQNEILYNCFPYGAYIGTKLINEGNGGPQNLLSMGLGIDGSRKSIYFGSGLTGKMDFINNQIVSLNNNQPITRYFETEGNSSFTVNMFNTDLWGAPEKAVVMNNNSGTLNLITANFQQRGYNGALTVGNGSKLNIATSNFNDNGGGTFVTGSNNVSMVNTVSSNTAVAQNEANFSTGVEVDGSSPAMTAISRNGWVATSNVNNDMAWQSLDGNLNTQWNSSWQAPGQWYQVDMQKDQDFDTIVTTLGNAPTDSPGSYVVKVSNDGQNWRQVASGSNNNIYSVGDQHARYVRIEQNSSKGNFWAIFEFYVLKSSTYDVGDGEAVEPEEPTTQCDLIVTDIYTKETKYAGDEVTFYAKIKNVGDAATPSGVKHGLALSVDDASENWCDSFYGPLQPGEEKELEMNFGPRDKATWTVMAGEHTISAKVDDSELISESDEENNTFTKDMTFTEKPTQESRENLAKGKFAEVSGYENEESIPTFAFDGDEGTRWSSNFDDNAWISVDLGKIYSVDKVVLKWEDAYGESYNILVSKDGNNWTTVKELTGQDGDEDVISFNPVEARYVKMQGVSRALPYGYSLWEMEVYGNAASGEEENPIQISDQVKIEGYQISYLLKGIRVLSSIEPTVDGKKVVRTGNIYGVASAGVRDVDLVIGSDNPYVKNFDSTTDGLMNQQMGASKTANYYAMTMINNGTTATDYNREYMVRVYAVLEDGSVVYSEAKTYSIYRVASYLYDNRQMSNYAGHSYLFLDILKVVNASYKEVSYKWGDILA